MSSPMSTSGQDGQQSHTKKPVEFQFCAECSNMLYPKEDEETRTLQFTCRTCHYTTNASNTCVFRNELNSSASLHAGIIEGMGKDPTLPRAKKTCQYCGFDEMVFFQAQQRTAETGMKQIYVCVECSKPQTD
ncbi:hypothetical protein MCOR02_011689 [Pyricularia oryzae]|uniref:DNA-directed RNA polymerase subunit n=1 Tax=Pyricularia oryzae (strain 70-15 / ATCC MYA-4617 / FGSC 8958) TaxID=242507 RepID=G4N0C4_PYRO7|nr:uncharacterized protein MGG_07391 [Pyricularia oryzae 70-15]KAH9428201.1 hypothetical protein MCOR02_011689 [Pyricularia oryzae]KAI6354966.1 hypothetical protein MCOR25_008399 [Pyricularia grisea]EHA51462.1 hypothetical protein MGG_07391 [Pyricularia oryzae 70-15]KAI6308839.1 hypothetical protein MCOR34_007091 [Pyricularia oryzae]KAI6462145.1 hypothetical protein MCOR17_006014 [Pyricularia oryzae]